MSVKEEWRPRLSITVSAEDFNKLNDLLGDWRIKSRLYQKMTRDLVAVMEKMSKEDRLTFIVAILEDEIKTEDWFKAMKGAKNAIKG